MFPGQGAQAVGNRILFTLNIAIVTANSLKVWLVHFVMKYLLQKLFLIKPRLFWVMIYSQNVKKGQKKS